MESMEQIYADHAKTVYGFLLAKTRDPVLAEELTQETFYRAVMKIGRFQGNSSVSTWLCAIAKNVWLEHLKKQKKRDGPDQPELQAAASAEAELFRRWDHIQLLKALHQLKEPMREVIYLRLAGSLTFGQIGEVLGKSENWARVNFYRGKEKLMQEVMRNER